MFIASNVFKIARKMYLTREKRVGPLLEMQFSETKYKIIGYSTFNAQDKISIFIFAQCYDCMTIYHSESTLETVTTTTHSVISLHIHLYLSMCYIIIQVQRGKNGIPVHRKRRERILLG